MYLENEATFVLFIKLIYTCSLWMESLTCAHVLIIRLHTCNSLRKTLTYTCVPAIKLTHLDSGKRTIIHSPVGVVAWLTSKKISEIFNSRSKHYSASTMEANLLSESVNKWSSDFIQSFPLSVPQWFSLISLEFLGSLYTKLITGSRKAVLPSIKWTFKLFFFFFHRFTRFLNYGPLYTLTDSNASE